MRAKRNNSKKERKRKENEENTSVAPTTKKEWCLPPSKGLMPTTSKCGTHHKARVACATKQRCGVHHLKVWCPPPKRCGTRHEAMSSLFLSTLRLSRSTNRPKCTTTMRFSRKFSRQGLKYKLGFRSSVRRPSLLARIFFLEC